MIHISTELSESFDLQIDELASLSDTPAPSVTRVLYTEKDVLARRYVCYSQISIQLSYDSNHVCDLSIVWYTVFF